MKVNISKMKVMRCAWDVAPKELAVGPGSVFGKRMSVTQSTVQKMATGCMGNVWECEEVW